MYALRAKAAGTLIDQRNCSFGDAFAIVTEHDEFMRRVKAAAKKSGHILDYHLLEYVDEFSYEGHLGIFKKDSGFAHQSEFRIALQPGTGAPYRLEVGDLSDIVIAGPLADVNSRLRVVKSAPALSY